MDIRIAPHALERVVIEFWQRLIEPLTRTTQMIIGEHGDDGGDIIATGGTNGDLGDHSHARFRSAHWQENSTVGT